MIFQFSAITCGFGQLFEMPWNFFGIENIQKYFKELLAVVRVGSLTMDIQNYEGIDIIANIADFFLGETSETYKQLFC